jgi:hypothetical protein
MEVNNRFYTGPMSDAARTNRHHRIIARQRASVQNRTPIANLIAEFWYDRVPGSPADMWRIITCRALCLGMNANPATNPAIAELRTALNSLQTSHESGAITRAIFATTAYETFRTGWHQIFTPDQQQSLEQLLGTGGGQPPALEDFIFHEWLATIHDDTLEQAGFARQTLN